MDFSFTNQQIAFKDSLKKLLDEECSTNAIRALWTTENGFDQ